MEQLKRASALKNVSVVLGGAVTRGAFEAGVLKVIAERELPVRRLVAASSGALNGTAYAAGVRRRLPLAAAEELIWAWEREGGFGDVIHISWLDILRGKGISDQKKLLSLLRRHVRPEIAPHPAPIELCIVVAPLNGALGSIQGEPATTYSAMVHFEGAHFEHRDSLERIFTAATASAAFPGLYTPVDVPGLGPCVDGGLVNSSPISEACGSDSGVPVDAVLLVVPTPAYIKRPSDTYRGSRLFAHVVDMLFDERLYQDLRTALTMRRYAIPIIPIRPLDPLPGDAFSGFFHPEFRRFYVKAGIERARQVLDQLGWS